MRVRPVTVRAVFLASVVACGGDYAWRPADVEVIRSAPSPGRTRSAVLVRHVARHALDSDTYKVAVAAGPPPVAAAAVARLADTAYVVEATAAGAVELRWAGETALTVVCARCGVQGFDVMERRDRLGPVHVAYEGFPRGTADSAR